jgi:hypothetical protein
MFNHGNLTGTESPATDWNHINKLVFHTEYYLPIVLPYGANRPAHVRTWRFDPVHTGSAALIILFYFFVLGQQRPTS